MTEIPTDVSVHKRFFIESGSSLGVDEVPANFKGRPEPNRILLLIICPAIHARQVAWWMLCFETSFHLLKH
jgi:hypothetical protein